jgi:cyclic pyranopterin phosphate synthase
LDSAPIAALSEPPAAGPLVDSYGRLIRNLRVSITDRCNFRCTYCMPEEGLDWLPREEILSNEEIARLTALFVRLGVEEVRITGGEPTVRKGLPTLIEMLAPLRERGLRSLSMTTNGSSLAAQAHDLAGAGLRRINVSLDSLRRDRFAALTRRDELPAVIAGIRAARDAGLSPVKINVVVVRGVNDDEVVDFARFGRDEGVAVRFIEFMPLDAEHRWDQGSVVPSAEIVAAIDAVFPLVREPRDHDPAEVHRFADGRGEIGVIGSVTEPFCASCDRVRLTADGQLRACLFATEETDLRALLRSGADDDALAAALATTVAGKWAGHGITAVDFTRPARSMSEIGG